MILLFETTTGERMYLKMNMFHYIHLAKIFV
jgi:predicted small integral membrane protein